MIKYRYTISIDEGPLQELTPIRDDSPTFNLAPFNKEAFLREELKGASMIFVNADYHVIDQVTSESEAILIKEGLIGTEYEERYRGVFYRGDCNFDADSLEVEVAMEPSDKYKTLLESLDKEFDLIELNVPKFEFDYRKQPVFQIIMLKDAVAPQGVITNIIGGLSYEEEIITVPGGGGDLQLNYNFGQIGNIGTVTGEVGMNPDISGMYASSPFGWERLSDGQYRISLDAPQDENSDLIVTRVSDNVVVYRAAKPASGERYDDWELVSETTGDKAKFINRDVYGRYLTNEETVLGFSTADIPETDVTANPPGYTKCISVGSNLLADEIQVAAEDVLIASNRHQVDPTPFPRIPDDADFFAGEYLLEPSDYVVGETFPIAESTWGEGSFWLKYDSVLRGVQEAGSKTITEKNGYLVSDVVQALLTAIGSDLTYAANSDHSDFLFNENNPIKDDDRLLIMVPKSNITQGEYNNPARYAPIKLQHILDMYLGVYKMKWHSEDDRLITESCEYYHRGKSYYDNNIGTDLTNLFDPKTTLSWDYKSNKWGYDKNELPELMRWYWMDDVSKPFRGFEIDVNSRHVKKGNIQEYRMSMFNPDIDYIQLAPNSISPKGFFLGEVELVDGRYRIPIATISPGNAGSYKLQNPYLSMIYLHSKYHNFVMPAASVTINVETVAAGSVMRSRIQRLEMPSGVINPDNSMNLIRTNLGDGQIKESTDKVDGSGTDVVVLHDLDK